MSLRVWKIVLIDSIYILRRATRVLASPSIGREPTQSGNEHYSLACCPLRFLTQASLFDLAGPLIKPGHFFVRRPLGGV